MMSQITRRPVIDASTLEAICRTIGDTNNGLTGTEIGNFLSQSKITDVSPGITKWQRLFNAFAEWQNNNQCSNHILSFIQLALNPVRFVGKNELFQLRLNEINKRLSFIGVELSQSGKYKVTQKANTVAEAEQRANHFRYKLEVRNVHQKIYDYCKPELLAENYFHSIFEATKSIADRIRQITGLYADGAELIDTAFSTRNPLIRINLLQNDTDRSEHLGLMNLIKSLLGLIRNPTAHEPKIKFKVDEVEALDLMILVSYAHKRLNKVI